MELKTNFLGTDHLVAGTVSDPDKMNGITTQINTNTTIRITNTGYVTTLFDTLVAEILNDTIATPEQCIWWKNPANGNKNIIETGTSTNYKIVSDKIICVPVLDEIDDSSIDAMWEWVHSGEGTQGTTSHTEGASTQDVNCTINHVEENIYDLVSYAKGTGSGGKNFKQAEDIRVNTKIDVSAYKWYTPATYPAYMKVGFTDGSNFVWFKEWTKDSAGSLSETKVFDVIIDQSENDCDVYQDNVLLTSGLDLSSLSSYYLCFYTRLKGWGRDDGEHATCRCWYVYWFDAATSATIYWAEETPGTNAVGAMINWTETEVGATVGWYITANDSDYTELTSESTDIPIGTPGTTTRVKAIIPLSGATSLWDGTKDIIDPAEVSNLENFVCIYRLV